MDLTNHREALSGALISAFPKPASLSQLTSYGLDVNLDAVTTPGPLKDRVFELIEWSRSEGRLGELYAEALLRNPGNSALKTLAAEIAKESRAEHEKAALSLQTTLKAIREGTLPANVATETPAAEAAPQNATDSLEALVWGAERLVAGTNIATWIEGLRTSMSQVCLVLEDGEPMGTGFLVGASHVITNAHVIPVGAALEYEVVFDYTSSDQALNILPAIAVAEELERSPAKELDYVILRLVEAPPNRRPVEVRPHSFALREPLHVIQHPGGDPMRIASGIVADVNSFLARVAYTANTRPGSSGSPVFDENWKVVAIHHHGEAAINNHGIPMGTILGKSVVLPTING
jgi:S1-C subfamily serine protease